MKFLMLLLFVSCADVQYLTIDPQKRIIKVEEIETKNGFCYNYTVLTGNVQCFSKKQNLERE